MYVPAVVTAMVCEVEPGERMPLDHASVMAAPDRVWADVLNGDPAGNVVAPGTSVAVWLIPVPSELANRMVSPTRTLVSAGANPPAWPAGTLDGACRVRLTSMVTRLPPPPPP